MHHTLYHFDSDQSSGVLLGISADDEAGHAGWNKWLTKVKVVENGSLEDRIGDGLVTNTGIEAGRYARDIINGGIVVGELRGVIELLQGVLKGSEGVLIAAVV